VTGTAAWWGQAGTCAATTAIGRVLVARQPGPQLTPPLPQPVGGPRHLHVEVLARSCCPCDESMFASTLG